VSGFLLDTNILSEFSRTGEPDQRVKNWIRNTPQEDLYVSILTVAEIRRGIALLPIGSPLGGGTASWKTYRNH
jgi:hypothetical protein